MKTIKLKKIVDVATMAGNYVSLATFLHTCRE